MSNSRNPILIGQAEVIDVLPPEVHTMLQRQGIYLASDSARPGFTVPLVVNADGVWSMEIDGRLDPEHFHKTVRISGPFFAPGEETDPVTTKDAAFAAAQIDERAVMHGLADRIVGNAAPDEDGRLKVAYAIARYLGLDWPAAAPEIDPADPWRGLYAPELMPKLDGVGDYFAVHPDVPEWPDDDERSIAPLIVAQGFTHYAITADYPWDEGEPGEEFDTCAWLANWKPEPPAGEDWRLVMIHDTEDGPAAIFVRPLALIDASLKGDAPRTDLVPGVVRCAKCSFQLSRTNLYMGSGTTGPGDSKTEPCPNGCGPLWPVTWQTWATEGWQQAERYHEELRDLQASPREQALDALQRAAKLMHSRTASPREAAAIAALQMHLPTQVSQGLDLAPFRALADAFRDEAAETWGEAPAHAAKQECSDRLFTVINQYAQTTVVAGSADTALLDAVQRNHWRVTPMDTPTGAGDSDVVWLVDAGGQIILEQEGRHIVINPESVNELCRLLKKLQKEGADG